MCSFSGHFRRCLLGTAGFGLVILVLGCISRSSPPGEIRSMSGGDVGWGFIFVEWKEGPILLLARSIPGSGPGRSTFGGHGSSNNPVYSWSASTTYADGRGWKCQIEATDGKVTTFRIDGKEYDLSQGTVFVLTTKADKVDVHQMKRDLSAVPSDAEACREFLNKDAEMMKALREGDLPK
jgi:hypothetical protein